MSKKDEEKITEDDVLAQEDEDSDIGESRIYELGFLLDGDIIEEAVSLEIQKIKDVVENGIFRFVSEGSPIKKELEYTVTVSRDGTKKNHDSAYFGWIKYEKDPQDIMKVQAELTKNPNIVRFIILKTIADDLVPYRAINRVETERAEKRDDTPREPISISKEELDKTIEELVID